MPGRRREVEIIPREQAAIVGANIRTLRTAKGLPQAQVAELMGWTSNSTVCAAEGRRGGRQRNFTTDEIERLADFFGIEAWQLTTRCANCYGQPPPGYTCQSCGSPGTPNGAQQSAPERSLADERRPQSRSQRGG
jgi:transcriptional regulator with XRE-family HTH domain